MSLLCARMEEETGMTELYSAEETARWKKQALTSRKAIWTMLAGCLIASIGLCFAVNTRNALTLQWTVIGLSTLGGWAAILLYFLRYRPAKAEYTHMEGILAGEAGEMEGWLTLRQERFSIPTSITVRKAELQTEEETFSLNVDERLASRMPEHPCRARIRIVRKYITAVEVLSENKPLPEGNQPVKHSSLPVDIQWDGRSDSAEGGRA